jgi:hypothetical protein
MATTKRGELCIRRRMESEDAAAAADDGDDDKQPHDDDGRRNHIDIEDDLENRMRVVGTMDGMMKC